MHGEYQNLMFRNFSDKSYKTVGTFLRDIVAANKSTIRYSQILSIYA